MTDVFVRWFKRNFSNPQAVILATTLLLGFVVIYFLGSILMPLLVAVVLSYLLDWAVTGLERKGMPRLPAVILVFVAFIAFTLTVLIGIVPLAGNQLESLFADLPKMASEVKAMLLALPEKYPEFITSEQIQGVINGLGSYTVNLGDLLVSISISSFKNLVTLLIYMILVPLLIFFMLKDKDKLLSWFTHWLPSNNQLAKRVWNEVDVQIGNYVRGKVFEIIIVGIATYLVFVFFGLNYALLLAVLVGLSVLIPYIGATLVTIPVALVAVIQWGMGDTFAYLMIAYFVIQALDGNLLVPLLFSEANNLHPVAIIASVLFFGGLWGFWGVFFAIPLATLVVAVIDAWEFSRSSSESQMAAD